MKTRFYRITFLFLLISGCFSLFSTEVLAAKRNLLKCREQRSPVSVQSWEYALGSSRDLFAGDSLDQWMNPKGEPVPSGWNLESGVLTRKSSAGDILSRKEFGNYVLEFEWAISPKGNSGVKYRVKKYGNNFLGCEYQILDDLQAGGEKNLTGSLYDIYSPTENKSLKPAGEFNHSKILVLNNRIEHWINGQRIVLAHPGTPDWKERVEKSKFKEHEGFGENKIGHLLLQDHGNEVKFRNVCIREIHPVPVRESVKNTSKIRPNKDQKIKTHALRKRNR